MMDTATLDTTCVCSDEEGNYLENCYGCFEDSLEWVKEVINNWTEAINFDGTEVRVDGKAIGWQRLSGYLETTVDELPRALGINGEYRLVFTLDGSDLSIKRYSHDEPTGASFTVTPIKELEGVA